MQKTVNYAPLTKTVSPSHCYIITDITDNFITSLSRMYRAAEPNIYIYNSETMTLSPHAKTLNLAIERQTLRSHTQ